MSELLTPSVVENEDYRACQRCEQKGLLECDAHAVGQYELCNNCAMARAYGGISRSAECVRASLPAQQGWLQLRQPGVDDRVQRLKGEVHELDRDLKQDLTQVQREVYDLESRRANGFDELQQRIFATETQQTYTHNAVQEQFQAMEERIVDMEHEYQEQLRATENAVQRQIQAMEERIVDMKYEHQGSSES